jgi:uncharacterized protein (DUF1330 family)
MLVLMAVYVISEVQVVDGPAAERYRLVASASIAAHGGRYIIRGAVPDAIEGDWPDERRMVVIEFPSAEAARGWYASPDYAEALSLRQVALERRLLLVEGV